MKTNIYKSGPLKYKAYFKPVGKGYEVGFMCGSKSLFVGNFIHEKEARDWYKVMNREFSHFTKKFWHNTNYKTAVGNLFYNKFIANTLYKHYYDYLDKCFGKYTKSFHREYSRDVKTYNRLKKSWAYNPAQNFVRKTA